MFKLFFIILFSILSNLLVAQNTLDEQKIFFKKWEDSTNYSPAKRSIISINALSYFYNSFDICYEGIFASGDFSVKFLFSYGLNNMRSGDNDYSSNYFNYYSNDKIFSSGIDFNYYPKGQGKIKYFIGPSVEFGEFYYQTYYRMPIPPYSLIYEPEKSNYTGFLLQNGFLFRLNKNINISANFGAGLAYSKIKYYGYFNPDFNALSYSNEVVGIVRIGLNAGICF